MNKNSTNKKKVRPNLHTKDNIPEPETAEEKENKDIITEEQGEENESFGGLPARDLKKNLGCGG